MFRVTQYIHKIAVAVTQGIALAGKGGHDLRETVKRMMDSLFTNYMCCIMNWTGTALDEDDVDAEDDEGERKVWF